MIMQLNDFKILVKQIQALDLEMILEVDRICKKYNLRYFLAYGTLLGAVRHHGFIPWDDDADLFMPNEDYKKFKEITKNELNQKFRFETLFSMPDNIVPWGKILYKDKILEDYPRQGLNVHHEVSIDIFPLYQFPMDEVRIKKIGKYNYRNFHILIGKTRWKNRNKIKYSLNRLYGIYHFGSKNHFKREMLKELERFEDTNQDYYLAPSIEGCEDQSINIFPQKWFDNYILMNYEGHLLPVPESYIKLLEQVYKDYMTLPPENKRWNINHDIVYYLFK